MAYSDDLEALNAESLEMRRLKANLSMINRMVHCHTALNFTSFTLYNSICVVYAFKTDSKG